MLFVIDKIRFQKFIAIVREDRKPSKQGKESPYLRICAEKDQVQIASSDSAAAIKSTVYEPGVLFIRTTLFRRVLRATPTDRPFMTFQVDKDGLVFADVRMPFETNDMVLYTNPAEAPMTYPPPLPAKEMVIEKPHQSSLFQEESPIADAEELAAKLKTLRFQEGVMSGQWKLVVDGIRFSACIHPLKGLAISYYYVTPRTACEDEIFLPKESAIQDIAQALVRIHDQLIPQKTE